MDNNWKFVEKYFAGAQKLCAKEFNLVQFIFRH